ncbi:MAG: hypothetical protein WA821_21885, partial [Anaerolineales bacterium]
MLTHQKAFFMRLHIWFVIIPLMALSFVACSPATPKPLTATASPFPSPTKAPTQTDTPTPTLAPAPSLTPHPIAVSPTEIPMQMDTPTPLATPARGAAAYRQKAWDEQTALDLVRVAEQFSYADNVGYFGNDRLNYASDQAAVKLAGLEALHRFPDADFKEKLEWRVALANAILGSSDSDAWILQQIETGLNGGRYQSDNLTDALNPYGFGIFVSESYPDLFGIGQPGQVLGVYIIERNSTSLYAALGKDGQGHYRLVRIYNGLSFNRADDGPSSVGDHTGDGIPEIILSRTNYNGSFTWSNTFIFQWKDDHFADLSRGQFDLDEDGAISGTWQYGTADASGAQPIEVRKPVSRDSSLVRFESYKWSGETYQLAESLVEKPDVIDRGTNEWPTLNMGEGTYRLLTDELPSFLSTPSRLDVTQLGPSYPDYLRFQLAQAYALQGESAKARDTLQQIIEKPQNPEATAIPQAAQAYLDHSTNQDNLYRACQA